MDERFENADDTIFFIRTANPETLRNKHAPSDEENIRWPISPKQFHKFYKRNLEMGKYTLAAPKGFQSTVYRDVVTRCQESPLGYEISISDH